MTLATLTTFLGWCLVVNLAFYTITALSIMLFRNLVTRMSARLFGVDEAFARNETFAYLARYKLYILVFFLAPYVALKLLP